MHKFTNEQLREACEDRDYIGFCRNCGAEHSGVEPDARNYVCEECDRSEVFGAEELFIMQVP